MRMERQDIAGDDAGGLVRQFGEAVAPGQRREEAGALAGKLVRLHRPIGAGRQGDPNEFPPSRLLAVGEGGADPLGDDGHQIGAASAAFLGGVMRDSQGDYLGMFLLAGVTGLAAAGISLAIKRGPAAAASA